MLCGVDGRGRRGVGVVGEDWATRKGEVNGK